MLKHVIARLYRRLKPGLTRLERYLESDAPVAKDPLQVFDYEKPAIDRQGSKEFVLLGRTSHLRGAVHVLRKGSEEHLHSHRTIDGFWFVLRGRARFHGVDAVIGEFGPMQGIVIPRNTRYWFESADDGDLELLQVLAFEAGNWHRQDHASPNFDKASVKRFDARRRD